MTKLEKDTLKFVKASVGKMGWDLLNKCEVKILGFFYSDVDVNGNLLDLRFVVHDLKICKFSYNLRYYFVETKS